MSDHFLAFLYGRLRATKDDEESLSKLAGKVEHFAVSDKFFPTSSKGDLQAHFTQDMPSPG